MPQIPSSINCHRISEATTFRPIPLFLETFKMLSEFFLFAVTGKGLTGAKGFAG